MKRATFLFVGVLAVLAGAASASGSGRSLQQLLPNLQLPPITEFLPPLEDISLPPLQELMAKVGLPKWEELGLPPLSEFMKPVGSPQGIKLPALLDVIKEGNEVMNKVVIELLPPELQSIVKKMEAKKGKSQKGFFPKFNMTEAAAKLNITLPPALKGVKPPPGLPPLDKLLAGLKLPGNATAGLNMTALHSAMSNPVTLPPLRLPENLPPLEDVLKAVNQANSFLQALPKPENLPSLDTILNVVNTLNSLAQSASGKAAGGAAVPAAALG